MDKVIKMLISLLGLMVLVAADSDKPAATLIPANAAQGSYISLLSGKVGLSEKDIEDMWTEDSATVDPDLPLEVLPPALPKLPTISLAATGERKYSVVIAQIAAVYKDPAASMAKVDVMLEKHKGKTIDLLVLPEMALSGYKFDNREDMNVTESLSDATFQWAKAKAIEFNAWVVVGFPEKTAEDVYHNSAMILNNKGTVVHVARKTNLTPSDKRWATKNPDYLSIIDTDRFGRVGVAICADISATSREKGKWVADNFFRSHNADTILLLAAWDTSKPISRVHSDWMARFGQNVGQNVVFIAADRTGSEKGVPFSGSSTVIDLQTAKPLARFDQSGEGLLVANVVQTSTEIKGFAPSE